MPMQYEIRQFAFTPAAMTAQFMAYLARRHDEVDNPP